MGNTAPFLVIRPVGSTRNTAAEPVTVRLMVVLRAPVIPAALPLMVMTDVPAGVPAAMRMVATLVVAGAAGIGFGLKATGARPVRGTGPGKPPRRGHRGGV